MNDFLADVTVPTGDAGAGVFLSAHAGLIGAAVVLAVLVVALWRSMPKGVLAVGIIVVMIAAGFIFR